VKSQQRGRKPPLFVCSEVNRSGQRDEVGWVSGLERRGPRQVGDPSCIVFFRSIGERKCLQPQRGGLGQPRATPWVSDVVINQALNGRTCLAPLMPQSLARVVVHIVFSTKHRRPWLDDKGIQDELYKYLAQILIRVECPAISVGGAVDYIHILCNLSRKLAIMDLLEELKSSSSKWIKTKGKEFQEFCWQGGYGIFSVSESKVPDVREYVDNQEQHHHRMTFQEEFRLLCQRHGIEIDERYVWD